MARSVSEPWRHVVTWREIGEGPQRLRLEADESTRAKIAKALRLESLSTLRADLALKPWLDGVEIDGRLRAVAGRICGVTLDPYDESVEETFRLTVLPAGSPHAPAESETEDVAIDLDAEDPPDVVAGEGVDLGHYVVEQLSLSLDPFPRKPDAVFEAPPESEDASPFAALAALKRPKDAG
ncbi:MAG TPA: DUF177 domain-containing protein [Caulobacteraceae bacterium]|nr:DUF177 domain-containing protein [Caulobacteraceae bacterium]